MKLKKILLLVIVLIVTSTIGCSNSDRNGDKENVVESEVNEEVSIYSDIYTIALDSYMPIDEGLNSDMQYIAINTQTLENATDEDIKRILDFFKKYKVDVIDESFESLKEKGMVKDGNYIEGVLLVIESINQVSENRVIIEGSKFRSGIGAIGVKSTIIKENGKWILDSAEMTWIS